MLTRFTLDVIGLVLCVVLVFWMLAPESMSDIKVERPIINTKFTYSSVIAGDKYVVMTGASLISKIGDIISIQTLVQLDSLESAINNYGIKQIDCKKSQVRDQTADGLKNWINTQPENLKIETFNHKLEKYFCR